MPTPIEYALLAGASYISNRGKVNQFAVPQGWIEATDFYSSDPSSGFEAATFIDGTSIDSSNNIVISFAGTDGNGGSILTNPDKQADLALGTGYISTQLVQAAEYYLNIKANAPQNASITLTGHSLGGGLAALIGVFFGVPATTFDAAPFARSAELNVLTPDVATELESDLQAAGYTSDQLAGLTNFIAQRQASGGIPNSNLVSDISVAGQLLSGLPYSLSDIIGTEQQGSPLANSQGVSGDDLHSQALLAAFLQSQQSATTGQALNDVTFKLTDLGRGGQVLPFAPAHLC